MKAGAGLRTNSGLREFRAGTHPDGIRTRILQPFIDANKGLPCFVHSFPREIKGHTIMHTQQRVTKLTPGETFRENIRHGIKVA